MKKIILILFVVCSGAVFAQDSLSSGCLIFEHFQKNKPITYDTIWYAPGIYRWEWGLTDYKKRMNYFKKDNDTTITTEKEENATLKKRIKKVKTIFNDNDTLAIAGILCKKATLIVTMQSDSIETYYVYYSPRVGGKNCNYGSICAEISGFSLLLLDTNLAICDRLIEYKPLLPNNLYIPDYNQTIVYKLLKKKHRAKFQNVKQP
ncbi:MAG: hypothetical protein WCP69_03960 [Bacteroidota bacterium]